MESWNHIINTALLGTDKRAIKKEDFAGVLAENTEVVYQTETDKEDQFLQLASVVYNYRQCGVLPIHNETLSFAKADTEEKQYCSAFAQSVLNDLLQVDSKPLLELWLNECIKKEMIVQPEMVPVLFDTATKHPPLQKEIVLCTGKRGLWLMQFNEDWKFKTISPDENLWQTGSLAERKLVLVEIRQREPEKGRDWLQSVWSQENAATKANLLDALEVNLSKDDEPWLESLLTDKSAKVKEEALRLLKIIPNSKIVQQYWNIISASVQLKKGKGVLGIGSKTELDFHLTGIDDSIYKTGIDKLSNQKAFSDEEFIFYQLIQNVPPHLWEEHFQQSPEEIITMFQKSKWGLKFLPAFVPAVVKFKNTLWAVALSRKENVFYLHLLDVLPPKEWREYSLKYIEQNPGEILESALERKEPWSIDIAKAVLKYTATNGYNFHKGFYNNIVHLLPIEIINDLEKCIPPEGYQRDMWNKNSEHIIQLLTLKTQTLQSFQS